MNLRQETPLGPAVLARRLRELRRQWPEARVTQGMLADALGGSTPLVSGWESTTNPSMPPVGRLLSYATVFATRRSLQDGQLRVLPDEELTDDERAARDALYRELLGLRDAAVGVAPSEREPGPPRSIWHFPDGAPVRLICGRVAPESAGAYADPGNPNFTQLHALADPDALIELFGHIRMTNPDSDVRFRLVDEMTPDDLATHVVLLGGLLQNPAARYFAHTGRLPVTQVKEERIRGGEVFEIEQDGDRQRFLPTFLDDDPSLGLIEDVGLLARMPNPIFRARTLTLCNGVFSRGVLGAVRTLTDAQLRDNNEAYLASRFAGESEFGLLLRVPVFRGEACTPDLTSEYHRLYAWPTNSFAPS